MRRMDHLQELRLFKFEDIRGRGYHAEPDDMH